MAEKITNIEETYHYDGRDWSWEALSTHLALLEKRADTPNATRYWPAMKMVEGDKVLDIGCNAGMFASRLASRGHTVTGVELEQSLLDIAIRRNGENENLRFVKIGR